MFINLVDKRKYKFVMLRNVRMRVSIMCIIFVKFNIRILLIIVDKDSIKNVINLLFMFYFFF